MKNYHDCLVDRYADLIIDWFNEDHILINQRIEIKNRIMDCREEDIAIDYMNSCKNFFIEQMINDGVQYEFKIYPIIGDYIDGYLGDKSYYSECFHSFRRCIEVLADALFTGLAKALADYLANEFEI